MKRVRGNGHHAGVCVSTFKGRYMEFRKGENLDRFRKDQMRREYRYPSA